MDLILVKIIASSKKVYGFKNDFHKSNVQVDTIGAA